MSVELHEEGSGKILIMKLTGKLTKQDYEQFTPEVERLIKKHGKLRMVVQMHEFHGWTIGAIWEDIKFDWRHFADIERLALVGDSKWEAGMASFCKPFTKAAVRYFYAAKAEEAFTWINEGIASAATKASP